MSHSLVVIEFSDKDHYIHTATDFAIETTYYILQFTGERKYTLKSHLFQFNNPCMQNNPERTIVSLLNGKINYHTCIKC